MEESHVIKDGFYEIQEEEVKQNIIFYATMEKVRPSGILEKLSIRAINIVHSNHFSISTIQRNADGSNMRTKSAGVFGYYESEIEKTKKECLSHAYKCVEKYKAEGYRLRDTIGESIVRPNIKLPLILSNVESMLHIPRMKAVDDLISELPLHDNNYVFEFYPVAMRCFYGLFDNEGMAMYDTAGNMVSKKPYPPFISLSVQTLTLLEDQPLFSVYELPNGNISIVRCLTDSHVNRRSTDLTWNQQLGVTELVLNMIYNDPTANIYDPNLPFHRIDYADNAEMKKRFIKAGQADIYSSILAIVDRNGTMTMPQRSLSVSNILKGMNRR